MRGRELYRWYLWQLWRWLAPLLLLAMLVVSARSAVPSWSAHLGQGVKGTWTQTSDPCPASSHGCVCRGDFLPAEGGTRLTDVPFHTPGGCLRGGGSVQVLAEGRDLYPADGGSAWFASSAGLLICSALLALWIRTDGRRLPRRVRGLRGLRLGRADQRG